MSVRLSVRPQKVFRFELNLVYVEANEWYPIQGQSQGHGGLKYKKMAEFKCYLLRI